MRKWIEKICAWLNGLPRGQSKVTGQELANKRREGTATHEDLCQ